MLELRSTSRFKKEAKRLDKRGRNMRKLYEIIEKLRKQEALPAKNRNHRLTGNWKDCWECHIEPDWLLIYQYDATTLILSATGTHSDLFE
jgi:mRNA interferase YafQ